MSFDIEQHFKDSLAQIPTQVKQSRDEDLPTPDYPLHEGYGVGDLNRGGGELITITDGLLSDNQLSDSFSRATISETNRILIEGAIREVGIDALAFYKSYRYLNEEPHKGKWGIFYNEIGLAFLQSSIQSEYPNCLNAKELAHGFFQAHERYHFKFDLYALSLEAHMKVWLYQPLHRAFRNHQIYLVEEALANRDVLEWAKRDQKKNPKPKNFKDFVSSYMKLQPGAYARFDEDEYKLSGELAANLFDLNFAKSARRMDQAYWVSQAPDVLLKKKYCPEYLVLGSRLNHWIKPTWAMPPVTVISETNSFAQKLATQYSNCRDQWENTKIKLKANPALRGLNFKKWTKDPECWSVRVNDNFRAHLSRLPNRSGGWLAEEFGPHKAMGHG